MKPHFKPIQADESKLFTVVVQENEKEFEYPWHYHPELELTYILKSRGMRYVGNSIENFTDDDLVMLGSNLPHCWINAPKDQLSTGAVVIYIKENFLDEKWMDSSEFESINKLMKLAQKGIRFEKSVALELKSIFLELNKVSPFEKFVKLLQILQKLSKTKKYDLLCEHGFSYELDHSQNERINVIYKFIEQHYQKKISLANVAAQVNMSEEYFSRFFSKTMKKSFFEFLNEYKINRACKLLIETDKQVSEICYASGFESIPFFYRQFKKFKNCQPVSYRANYQKALE